jgi:hypothetical protein
MTTRFAPTEAHEERLEIPLAGLLHLLADDAHVVDDEEAVGVELGQVEAQGRHIGGQVGRRLLEGDEHPRLAVIGDAPDQELHGQQGLAGPGRSADQGGSAPGQTAPGHRGSDREPVGDQAPMAPLPR